MSTVEILIKPVSVRCNLSCEYCFYRDESAHRSCADHGMMDRSTAVLLISRAFEIDADEICFTFQGGEPTLAGLPFFQFFVREAQRQNTSHKKLFWSLQTNGTLMNDDWAVFLQEHHFLVGLSLDGPEKLHDKYRGSFQVVVSALDTLRKYGIIPNILCVVTDESDAEECYRLFKTLGIRIMQFIPCLEEIGQSNRFLSPAHYGVFLTSLYDLWLQDLRSGSDIVIRYFENLAQILSGNTAESCNFCGGCQLQFVTESNGNVYPCDFYCMDDYLLGNIKDCSYLEMAETETARNFIRKRTVDDYDVDCRKCSFFKLCKAGCRRAAMHSTRTQFCSSYRQLFEHMKRLAKR